MTRLLCVRHGQTQHNLLGKICTHTDEGVVLSPLGRRQAADLALRLAGLNLAAVYASPMLRALDTARPIADAHGLPVQRCSGLRELSAGELDGRDDEEAFTILNAGLDAWCAGDDTVRIGETGDLGADVVARFRGVLGDMILWHPHETVVLVSHGGLLQIGIPWLCRNLSPSYGHRRHISNSAIIEVEVDPASREPICVAWGEDMCAPQMTSVLQ
jgi:broad specificity phosphatase PhoE